MIHTKPGAVPGGVQPLSIMEAAALMMEHDRREEVSHQFTQDV